MLLLLLGCVATQKDPAPADDSGGVETAETSETGETGETGEPAVIWTACEDGTECADVSTPLDHAAPDGERILLHVRRLPTERAARRAVWIVVGGPGDAGTPLLPALTFLQDAFPRIEVVAFDHRGTGASAALHCPDQEDEASVEGATIADGEWPACRAALDEAGAPLAQMSVSQAADDLAWLIDRVHGGELPVVVWGISYGTFLVNRYLLRHPDQAEGAILDGLVPPDWTFAEFDAAMDTTGREYLALCTADPDCAAHLGGDAEAFAEAALAARDAAPCGPYDRATSRAVLGALLLVGDHRAAIPSTLVRLARCDDADQAALAHLAGTFPSDATQNEALLVNIGVSELWPEDGPDPEAADAALAGSVIATGVSAWMAGRAEQWPGYPREDGEAAAPPIPALLLHGGLDPTVRLARTEALRTAYPLGQSVTPPGAGHVTINSSSCAGDAYGAFLDDPATAVVGDCTDEAFTEAFTLGADESVLVFGTPDPWGG